MAKLLSGKVGVQTYAGLSTSRNQIVGGQPTFIGLNEVEPNLGLSPQNSYVLYGDANGTRRWGEPSGAPSGSVSGITIRDEGLNPVGMAGSVTIIDIVGDGVVAIQTHITQGGVQVGLATLTIPANNLDGEDGRGYTQVTGISTIRVGAGLSIFAPSGTTGIASIRSLTQVGVDVYNPASYLTVSEASQIQVGSGLSVTQPQVNRAKIEFEGIIPRLEVTGISTFNQTSLSDASVTGILTATGGVIGNLTGNVVGNVTGDLNGNVTGNVTGNLTGDVYAGLATATKGFTGNINASGVSTITQLLVTTINNTGFETAFGYIASGNSFMGNLNSGGISTTKYLANTNINSTGIITATSFVGPLTGNVNGTVTGDTNGTHTGAVVGNVTGNLNGNVTGNLTGNFLAGLSTVTNEMHIKSDDGTPGRINYYCESGNSHYVQVKSPPHSEYSGNITTILPKKSGDFIVGDTVGAIDQNIHTSGIITATSFSGSGQNITDVSAASVLVTATDTTNATHYMIFSDSVSGQETMRTDNSLTYNPSSNLLSLNGNINVSDITCHNITPELNNTYNLGTNTQRFANIYSADLQLSNINAHPNSVDGTKGDWTLQEGENDIFMINNITGKKFKINLTEV